MLFFETRIFTKLVYSYLTDDGLMALQQLLIANPRAGNVIQGTGGLRKLRWLDPGRRKGKRGGLRVIYYFFDEDEQIWLLTLYDKDEADDLDNDTRQLLSAALAAEKAARKKRHEERHRGS